MLRRDIVRGRVASGEKLRIEALAERYGVGQTPIREALNRLTSEELVVQQENRGFRVPPLSRDDLLELTRTREWVTEIALREAIAHGDPAWEEGIVLAFHRLSRTPHRAKADPQSVTPEWETQHRSFHHALIAACPSRQLLEFSDRLFDAADRYRHLASSQAVAPRDVMHEHREIMEAALAHRTVDAIALLNQHTRLTTETLLRQLGEARDAPA